MYMSFSLINLSKDFKKTCQNQLYNFFIITDFATFFHVFAFSIEMPNKVLSKHLFQLHFPLRSKNRHHHIVCL